MPHGLSTSCNDRAAVQQFRSRAATIWGIPDGSALFFKKQLKEKNINVSAELSKEQLATIALINV